MVAKFVKLARQAGLIIAGLALAGGVITLAAIGGSQPRQFAFLGGAQPARVVLQDDGGLGRDTRYYVLKKPFADLAAQANSELDDSGWRLLHDKPQIWRRGRHGFIEIWPADDCQDTRLTSLVPKDERGKYSFVEVVDPRWRVAIKDHILSLGAPASH